MSNHTATQQEPKVDFGFYAPIPRIVRTEYKMLTVHEKWLYVCLKDLCGKNGTCFRTVATLHEETDISTGMISESIPKLHKAGLIHAEKKRRTSGGKEVWHITIVDIWQANAAAHPSNKQHSQREDECSPDEQTSKNVHSVNENVHHVNDNSKERSPREQERSQCETEGISLSNIIIEERSLEEESDTSDTSAPLSVVTPSPVSSSQQKEKKTEKVSRKSEPKAKPEPEPLAAEEQAVYDEWRGIFNKPIPLTDTLRKHIKAMVEYQPQKDEIVGCRLWMYQNDTKNWYRSHGLGLGDVVRDFERFRSLNFVPAQFARNTQSSAKPKSAVDQELEELSRGFNVIPKEQLWEMPIEERRAYNRALDAHIEQQQAMQA